MVPVASDGILGALNAPSLTHERVRIHAIGKLHTVRQTRSYPPKHRRQSTTSKGQKNTCKGTLPLGTMRPLLHECKNSPCRLHLPKRKDKTTGTASNQLLQRYAGPFRPYTSMPLFKSQFKALLDGLLQTCHVLTAGSGKVVSTSAAALDATCGLLDNVSGMEATSGDKVLVYHVRE